MGFYIVMSIQHFDIEPSPDNIINLPVPVKIETKMSGYLPVYETLEDAKTDFPDSQIFEGKLTIN